MSADLGYVLGVVGAGLALVNARTVFRTSLNTKVFLTVLRKWAEAGDYTRIRKVVAMDRRPELLELTRRWLDLELPAVVHEPGPRGYREPAPVASIEERTREALAPHVAARRAWLKTRLPLSGVGAALLLAALVLGIERSWIRVLCGIGSLLAIYGGHGIWRLRRDLLLALEVLPTLPRPPDEAEEATDEGAAVASRPAAPRPSRLMVHLPGTVPWPYAFELGVATIGRLPGSELHLEHPSVARRHAILEVTTAVVVLTDLGSPEGLRVNGEGGRRRVLQVGDRIAIGDYELVAH